MLAFFVTEDPPHSPRLRAGPFPAGCLSASCQHLVRLKDAAAHPRRNSASKTREWVSVFSAFFCFWAWVVVRAQTATKFSISKADFCLDFLMFVLVSTFQPQTFSLLALNSISVLHEPFIFFHFFFLEPYWYLGGSHISLVFCSSILVSIHVHYNYLALDHHRTVSKLSFHLFPCGAQGSQETVSKCL